MGAEVTGIDLAKPLDPAALAELRQIWLENIVVCFPGQDIEAEELMTFCSQFGELHDNYGTEAVRLHPKAREVLFLSNKPVDVKGKQAGGSIAGQQWHSDLSFTDHPASATFLLAKELPEIGGNTAFANSYLAYDSLSPAMQAQIGGLSAVHDIALSANFPTRSAAEQARQREVYPAVVHPVVRVHPETGRKALYVGPRVRKFVGMSEEESKPLLGFLIDHALRYEFVYRHVWTVNDLVMWDNRAAMHYAVQDYDPSQMRRMLRCSLRTPKSGEIYSEDRERALAGAAS